MTGPLTTRPSGTGTEAGTDAELIGRSLRTQPDAFVGVVRRHEVALHGFLARRAGRQAADDLLGEVWLRAFAARAGYDHSYGDARPWLYGIARNVCQPSARCPPPSGTSCCWWPGRS
jgi:RNA polymerase sigma-70 factor (ECF subfamily)